MTPGGGETMLERCGRFGRRAALLGLAAFFVGFAFVLVGPGKDTASAAGGGVRGVWTAERSNWRVEKGGTATLVQLSLRRVGNRHGWNSSQPVPLAELAGLTSPQLEAPSADVQFGWKRDAGAFAFEGRFEAGAGAGHFTFTPDAGYVADMRARGYSGIDDEKALMLAIHDVSRAFIAQLASLGYDRVPFEKLVALCIHGARPEYLRGLAGLGYKQLDLEQVVAFRIHGASLDFIRDVQQLGFRGLPAEQVVAFRIHGVSPEFIREFREHGYDRLTADQLVAMRIHGVTPEFVRQLKALGYSAVPVDDLVAMRIHGVTSDFIRRVQGRSGKDVTVDRLVSMRIHGQEPR
jgi:hypothetical protein